MYQRHNFLDKINQSRPKMNQTSNKNSFHCSERPKIIYVPKDQPKEANKCRRKRQYRQKAVTEQTNYNRQSEDFQYYPQRKRLYSESQTMAEGGKPKQKYRLKTPEKETPKLQKSFDQSSTTSNQLSTTSKETSTASSPTRTEEKNNNKTKKYCKERQKEKTVSEVEWEFVKRQLDLAKNSPKAGWCQFCHCWADFKLQFCVNCFITYSYYRSVNSTPLVAPDYTLFEFQTELPEVETEEQQQEIQKFREIESDVSHSINRFLQL